MGDKIGRVHLGRQDLSDLQTRKMKGLKRGRDTDIEEEDESEVGDLDFVSAGDEEEMDDESDAGVDIKRPRLV